MRPRLAPGEAYSLVEKTVNINETVQHDTLCNDTYLVR